MMSNLATFTRGEANAQKLALVLPGYMDTKDYPHIRSHVELLASLGYLAIAFDPPGTWESGDDLGKFTISAYIQTVNKLIEQNGNLPTTLIGHSVGGYVACLAAAKNPQIATIAAIMAPHGYLHLPADAARLDRWRTTGTRQSDRSLPGNLEESRRFDVPYSFAEDALMYESLSGLCKLEIPKLFISGLQDTVVPEQLVLEAFEAAAEPKTYRSVAAEHDYRYHPDQIALVNDALTAFLV